MPTLPALILEAALELIGLTGIVLYCLRRITYRTCAAWVAIPFAATTIEALIIGRWISAALALAVTIGLTILWRRPTIIRRRTRHPRSYVSSYRS